MRKLLIALGVGLSLAMVWAWLSGYGTLAVGFGGLALAAAFITARR